MLTGAPFACLPPYQQLLSRHDELKEKARQLLEATKREAREKAQRRQNSREKEEKTENEMKNGDVGSPKKVFIGCIITKVIVTFCGSVNLSK